VGESVEEAFSNVEPHLLLAQKMEGHLALHPSCFESMHGVWVWYGLCWCCKDCTSTLVVDQPPRFAMCCGQPWVVVRTSLSLPVAESSVVGRYLVATTMCCLTGSDSTVCLGREHDRVGGQVGNCAHSCTMAYPGGLLLWGCCSDHIPHKPCADLLLLYEFPWVLSSVLHILTASAIHAVGARDLGCDFRLAALHVAARLCTCDAEAQPYGFRGLSLTSVAAMQVPGHTSGMLHCG
jgi:hypothetical protein